MKDRRQKSGDRRSQETEDSKFVFSDSYILYILSPVFCLLSPPQFDAWVKQEVPLARWGQPHELVGAAIFLASEASSYINGHTIYSDGGWQAAFYFSSGYFFCPVKLMVGVEVEKFVNLPIETFTKTIPGGLYAVFPHRLANGGYAGANDDMDTWLKESEYRQAYPICIQLYDERFKHGDHPDSEIDFLIPIVKGNFFANKQLKAFMIKPKGAAIAVCPGALAPSMVFLFWGISGFYRIYLTSSYSLDYNLGNN